MAVRELWTLPILQDSRQQIDRSALFPTVTEGRWKWNVTVTRNVTLGTGDYSLPKWTGRHHLRAGISIEWKRDWDEIAGNLKEETESGIRFKKELGRLLKFERRIIVVCQPEIDIFDNLHDMPDFNPQWDLPPGKKCRNKWNPKAILAKIASIEECGIAVKFFSGEPQAALYVTDMLRRFAEKKRELGEWEP